MSTDEIRWFDGTAAVAGKSIMEHNEILGMDAALKYINQTLVDKIGDITLQVGHGGDGTSERDKKRRKL